MGHKTLLRTDRIGLVIIFASLLAIGATLYQVFSDQHEQRVQSLRSHGTSLARVLSGVPYEQLLPGGKQQSIVQILQLGRQADDFAYVSIVDIDGRAMSEVIAADIVMPKAEIPQQPTSWLGERRITAVVDNRGILEFHAPVFGQGEVRGFVRVGYKYPQWAPSPAQLPLLGTLALPVFLLVPLFYFLLRKEVRPIVAANREIARQIESESFRVVDIQASGELGTFMQRFNRLVEQSNNRLASMQADQDQLLTSTKLLTYRKNRIEAVLESIPESLLILDESGEITFANQKFAVMFNVQQDAVLTRSPQEWCDNPDVLQLLSKYQTGGNGRAFSETMRFSLSTAVDRAIATRTFPLFVPSRPESPAGTLIIFRDESQEVMAKQARTEFVSHLSHELKSPLNVLAMYSETLLTEAGKSDEFRIEAANVISEEVRRLGKLISGLLNMTQIESGSLSPDKSLVKLDDVATAAFEEAKHSAKDKDYNFEFVAPAEMSPVFVDKELIRIAVTNLLSNAVKYNTDGGTVRLTIEETEDAVQLRVADSGIGISDTDAAQVFRKFYRSEDDRVQSVGGHGIGLALTKQIVELHQGSLSLNHAYRDGAEFIINLWKETSAVKQAI